MNSLRIQPGPVHSLRLKPEGGPELRITTQSQSLRLSAQGVQGPRGLSGVADYVQRVASVAPGQSSFALDHVPSDPALMRLYVNGHRHASPDISLVGGALVWAEPFTLQPSDTVEITYPI